MDRSGKDLQTRTNSALLSDISQHLCQKVREFTTLRIYWLRTIALGLAQIILITG